MNQAERIAYNKKRWLITKIKFIILGIVCILSGSVRYYYYGYHDNELVSLVTLSFVWVGWLILFIAFGMKYYNDKKITFKKDKVKWFRVKSINTLVVGVFALILVGHIILLDTLENTRIERILNTEPTIRTTTVILGNEMHNSRGGAKKYARFEYNVGGIVISKSVFNEDGRFIPGKTYVLVYSVEYPEMFKIYSGN